MADQYIKCSKPGCEEEVDPARHALGYRTCIYCGSSNPTRTISIPYNKGAYQLITEEGLNDIGRK